MQLTNNRGIPVFHSYTSNETAQCLIPIMEKFKEGYTFDATLLFIVDKDFSEIKALRETFPAVPIHICAFHASSAVKKALPTYLSNKACQDTVHNLFIKQRRTMEEEEYENLKTSISNLLPDTGRRYFEKNWWSMPELWAFCKNEATATFGINTTNHAESYHQKIKVFLNVQKSLSESVKGLLTYDKEIFKASLDSDNKTLITRQYHTKDDTPEATEIFRKLVPYAAKLVHCQLQLARKENATTKDATTSSHCSCLFYSTYILPCRHIFKFRLLNNLSTFSETICSQRFKKSNLQNSSNDIPIPTSCAVVQNVTKKIRTVEDKYKCSQALMKEFSSYLCLLGTEEFEGKHKFLADLLHEWKQGHSIQIQTEQAEIATSIDVIQQEFETQHLEENEVHSNIDQNLGNNDMPIIESISANDYETQTTVLQLETEEHVSTYVTGAQEHDGESEVMHNVQPTGENSIKLMDDFQYTMLTKIAIRGRPNQKQNFTKRKRKQPVSFSSLTDEQKKRILF